MNIFTANQVNHVYVVNTYPASGTTATLSNSDVVATVKDGNLYFTHKGKGGTTRSDIIPLDNIMYGKGSRCEKTRQKLMSAVVTINSEALSSSAPIAGQDYILNLDMQNPIGMSPDNKYMTFGAVHVPTSMTAKQFYAKMVESVNRNAKNALDDYLVVGLPAKVGGISLIVSGTNADIMSALKIKTAANAQDTASGAASAAYVAATKILTISVDTTNGSKAETIQEALNGITNMPNVTITVVSSASNLADSTGVDPATNGIMIAGKESSWIKGLKQQKPIVFTVLPSTITVTSGTAPNTVKTEVYWGNITYSNAKKITGGEDIQESIETTAANVPFCVEVKNGKLMADFEYFYMGERADQYRYVGWPNYVPTDYMVDETAEYDTVAIHYAYTGSNHAVQKSEKDITFLVKRDSTNKLAKVFADAINTATGKTIFALNDAKQFEP